MNRKQYRSSLRRDYARLTRNRIVEAVIEQLSNGSLSDFSVPGVAKRAGVSEATIYRNFPNRDAMMEGVAQYWEENYEVPPLPTTAEDTALHAERNFAFFEKNAALVRAMNEANLIHVYRRHRARVRGEATRKALSDVTGNLPAADVERAVKLILHLDSSLTWKVLTDAGLPAGEATRTVGWAIRALIAELRRANQRAGRAGG